MEEEKGDNNDDYDDGRECKQLREINNNWKIFVSMISRKVNE
jgi:hypothetical protein